MLAAPPSSSRGGPSPYPYPAPHHAGNENKIAEVFNASCGCSSHQSSWVVQCGLDCGKRGEHSSGEQRVGVAHVTALGAAPLRHGGQPAAWKLRSSQQQPHRELVNGLACQPGGIPELCAPAVCGMFSPTSAADSGTSTSASECDTSTWAPSPPFTLQPAQGIAIGASRQAEQGVRGTRRGSRDNVAPRLLPTTCPGILPRRGAAAPANDTLTSPTDPPEGQGPPASADG